MSKVNGFATMMCKCVRELHVISCVVLVVVCAPCVYAGDEYAPSLFDLQQAAINNNPNLVSDKISQTVAKEEVEIASSRWRPSVSLYTSKSYSGGDERYGNTIAPKKERKEEGAIGLSVSQTLYDRTIGLDVDQAQLKQQVSQLKVDDTQSRVTNRVVALFLDALALNTELNLLNEQLAFVSEQQKLTEKSYDVGSVPITDALDAKAKYARIDAQKQALEWKLEAKKSEIKTITSLPFSAKAYPTGSDVLPDMNGKDMDYWLALYQTNNRERKAGELESQIAEIEHKKMMKQRSPKIKLSLDQKYNFKPWNDNHFKTYEDNKREWSASLRMEIPFFGSEVSKARERKALALYELKKAQVDAATEQSTVKLQQAYYRVLANKAEHKGLFIALQSAEQALASNQLGYKVGMRINTEVLDAQRKRYQVNKERLIKWYDTWRSYFELQQLAGNLGAEQLQQIDSALRSVTLNEETDVGS